MRSDRWTPTPGTSDSPACDFLAGAAVPCYPAKAPVWLDLTLDAPAWVCTPAQDSGCAVAASGSPCGGVFIVATEGQTIVRADGADWVLNGASLWDPWDHDATALATPLQGLDQVEVLP